MSCCVGLASMFVALFVTLTLYPLENNTIMAICMIALPTLFIIMIGVANAIEEKLTDRIKALETKLKDKEERK